MNLLINFKKWSVGISISIVAMLALQFLTSLQATALPVSGEGIEGWVYLHSDEGSLYSRDRIGAPLGLQADDDYAEVELPFEFDFYDGSFDYVHANTNGMLCFDPSNDCDSSSGSLYDEDYDMGYVMAPFWRDLTTDLGTTNDDNYDIYTYTEFDGEGPVALTIQWVTASYDSELPIDFSVTLLSSGEFLFNYGQNQTAFSYEEDDFLFLEFNPQSVSDFATVGISGQSDFDISAVDICDEEGDEYCTDPHYADSILFEWDDEGEEYYYETTDGSLYSPLYNEILEPALDEVLVHIYLSEEEEPLELLTDELGFDGELVDSVYTDEYGRYFSDEVLPGSVYYVVVNPEDLEEPEGPIFLEDFEEPAHDECLIPLDLESHVRMVEFSIDYELGGEFGPEAFGEPGQKHVTLQHPFTLAPECIEEEEEEPEEEEEVAEEAPVDDDGITTEVEDAGPNNGDTNGDGTKDSEQAEVAGAVNPATQEYAAVSASVGALGGVTFVEESSLETQDEETEFPVGLVDFTIDCGLAGCSSNVTITYDQDYDISTWDFKKFQNGAFTDISSIVTYGTVNVGGNTVTTATYSLVDGGVNDADGEANGVIVDPAGPSVGVLAATGASAYVAPAVGVTAITLVSILAYATRVKIAETVRIQVKFL